MKNILRITNDEAIILRRMISEYAQSIPESSTMRHVLGEDLYKLCQRITRAGEGLELKQRKINLTVLETSLLYLVFSWHRSNANWYVPHQRIYMKFDQPIPPHLQKHINVFRALLNPITGERLHNGELITAGGVA